MIFLPFALCTGTGTTAVAETTFDAVADAVAFPTLDDGEVVRTLRYSSGHTVGDGSGNVYVFDASSPGTPDGGHYIPGTGGQLVALNRDQINALQFGAVPSSRDGDMWSTTGESASTRSARVAKLQACIDKATALLGAPVELGAQTWEINQDLRLKTGAAIYGAGDNQTAIILNEDGTDDGTTSKWQFALVSNGFEEAVEEYPGPLHENGAQSSPLEQGTDVKDLMLYSTKYPEASQQSPTYNNPEVIPLPVTQCGLALHETSSLCRNLNIYGFAGPGLLTDGGSLGLGGAGVNTPRDLSFEYIDSVRVSECIGGIWRRGNDDIWLSNLYINALRDYGLRVSSGGCEIGRAHIWGTPIGYLADFNRTEQASLASINGGAPTTIDDDSGAPLTYGIAHFGGGGDDSLNNHRALFYGNGANEGLYSERMIMDSDGTAETITLDAAPDFTPSDDSENAGANPDEVRIIEPRGTGQQRCFGAWQIESCKKAMVRNWSCANLTFEQLRVYLGGQETETSFYTYNFDAGLDLRQTTHIQSLLYFYNSNQGDVSRSIRHQFLVWEPSGADAAAWYLRRASPTGSQNPGEKPDGVDEDGSPMSEGTLGSLANGEWSYGDVDSIGYNTIYVQPAVAAGDPDNEAEDFFEATYNASYAIQYGPSPLSSGSGGRSTIQYGLIENQGAVNAKLVHLLSVNHVQLNLKFTGLASDTQGLILAGDCDNCEINIHVNTDAGFPVVVPGGFSGSNNVVTVYGGSIYIAGTVTQMENDGNSFTSIGGDENFEHTPMPSVTTPPTVPTQYPNYLSPLLLSEKD